MKKRFPLLLVAVVIFSLVMSACGGAAPQPEEGPIPLEFRLNWTLYGEHAPFFLGVDKGFYLDEGLDVSIVEGSGSSTTVKLIGNGTNNIGYADSATMMRGVTAGVPESA